MRKIISYKFDHIEIINKWREARNLDSLMSDDLPSLGITIEEDNLPIAVGFLRLCEGNIAILDSVITDPVALPSQRDDALNLLFSGLTDISKMMNIKRIIGFSVDQNTLKRSIQFGFKESDHTLMTLKVEG